MFDSEHSEASAPGKSLPIVEIQTTMEQAHALFCVLNSFLLTRNWKILHSVQDDKIFYS
jgi:hypothetical protein